MQGHSQLLLREAIVEFFLREWGRTAKPFIFLLKTWEKLVLCNKKIPIRWTLDLIWGVRENFKKIVAVC